MAMFGYGRFTPAQAPETPDYVGAVTAEARAKADAKARANSLRSQNMLGAARIYNQGMGDRSPIADKIEGMWGGETTPTGESPWSNASFEEMQGEPMQEMQGEPYGKSPWSDASFEEMQGEPMQSMDAAAGSEAAGSEAAMTEAAATEAAATEAAAAEAAAAEAAAAEAAAAEASASSSAASSTPWGAIAAAAAKYEDGARRAGRRSNSDAQWRTDLLSGKVIEQDAEAAGDKIGGPLGKLVASMGRSGNVEGAYHEMIKDPITKALRDPLNPIAWFR